MDDRWAETGAWVGKDLRREVFFFASGGGELYGSLYAPAAPPAPPTGVVVCNSWGYEGNQADGNTHLIALRMAQAGSACLLFHYPGFGDSPGDLAEASMERLVAAAADAREAASRRLPGASWDLAGMMLGSSVAALAAARGGVARLLLVQPALQPSRYFARLERNARRAAARVPARAGNAYGYPLPRRILAAGEESDAAVAAALGGFEGEGAVVRHERPPRNELAPERFEDVVVPGTWRFGARQRPDLARAASDWLGRTASVRLPS